jgi:hypothetical protein
VRVSRHCTGAVVLGSASTGVEVAAAPSWRGLLEAVTRAEVTGDGNPTNPCSVAQARVTRRRWIWPMARSPVQRELEVVMLRLSGDSALDGGEDGVSLGLAA